MKAAKRAAGLDDDDELGGAGALVQVAKAFGFNLPQMSKERDDLILKLQESQNEAQKVHFQSQLDAVNRRFEEMLATIKGSNNPIQDAIGKVAEKVLLDRMQGSGDDMDSWLKKKMFERFEQEWDQKSQPQGPISQLNSALSTIKELREVMEVLAPAPQPSGMSPEDLLTLETHKLDIEKEIKLYQIDKDTEVARSKSEAWTTVARYVGNGLELIGKNIAEQILAAEGIESPAEHEAAIDSEGGDAAGEWMKCPTCNNPSLYITTGMRQRAGSGDQVPVNCTNCGAEHLMGLTQDAKQRQRTTSDQETTTQRPSASNERPPAADRRARYHTNSRGKEVTRFAAVG